jgi:hypothetical protein
LNSSGGPHPVLQVAQALAERNTVADPVDFVAQSVLHRRRLGGLQAVGQLFRQAIASSSLMLSGMALSCVDISNVVSLHAISMADP